MGVRRMVAYPEKCTGCLLCATQCSLQYEGLFNPLKARLSIQRPISGPCHITFTDECNDCFGKSRPRSQGQHPRPQGGDELKIAHL